MDIEDRIQELSRDEAIFVLEEIYSTGLLGDEAFEHVLDSIPE